MILLMPHAIITQCHKTFLPNVYGGRGKLIPKVPTAYREFAIVLAFS